MLKKLIITIGLSTLLLSTGTAAVYAYQIDDSYKPTNTPFGLKEEIKDRGAEGATVLILQIIAGALLYFAAPVAIILIGFGAFSMVTGGADTEKLEQAKKHLTWTILGLLAIILSYSIVRIVIKLVIETASSAT